MLNPGHEMHMKLMKYCASSKIPWWIAPSESLCKCDPQIQLPSFKIFLFVTIYLCFRTFKQILPDCYYKSSLMKIRPIFNWDIPLQCSIVAESFLFELRCKHFVGFYEHIFKCHTQHSVHPVTLVLTGSVPYFVHVEW
jgi:hypothetical protein